MDKFFKLKERGTSVSIELIAGLTTFFSMVYILMVNANMFANPFGDGSNSLGVSYGAIYIATAISAVVGTILAGLLANLPLAQAIGIFMAGALKNIDWNNFKVSVPAFLTFTIMPFTYNISYGIAFGPLSYIVISVFCGDVKKVKGSSWVIAALFVAMLLLTH